MVWFEKWPAKYTPNCLLGIVVIQNPPDKVVFGGHSFEPYTSFIMYVSVSTCEVTLTTVVEVVLTKAAGVIVLLP
jgi:hypothetical protein